MPYSLQAAEFRQQLSCSYILQLLLINIQRKSRNRVNKLIEYRQMKMDISADKRYTNAVFYVLNIIKDKLLFDLEQKQEVDYILDCNVKMSSTQFLGHRFDILL